MTKREMKIMFELKAVSMYGAKEGKPYSKEIEFWLNAGVNKFVKTRFSGVNSKLLAYEQDQKRIEDLRSLKSKSSLLNIQSNNSEHQVLEFIFKLPDDYFITTGETAYIVPISEELGKCWDKTTYGDFVPYRTLPMECTDDNVDEKLTNSLSDHRFHGKKTRPLRVHNNETISVYCDSTYGIKEFVLTYLRKPKRIDLHADANDMYLDFPEHAHEEIVNLGVQLYLENKEKRRHQTFTEEVNVME